MIARLRHNLSASLIVALAFLSSAGCATTFQRTKEDAAMIREGAHITRPSSKVWMGPFVGPVWVFVGVLHLPLSVIQDTITLPLDARKPKPPNKAPEPTPPRVSPP